MGGSRAIAILTSMNYIQLSCLLPILYSPLPINKNLVPHPNQKHYIKELQKVADKSNQQLHQINYPKIQSTGSVSNFF